ncbi:hypothetical protein LTR27_011173 [Elasticomyces elasticus]|nr:hypothetical protein LTR27_011173 [Elasticomyces elasticus]
MALRWILALAARTTALPTIATISSRASTPASNHCGAPDSSVIVSGTPWIVYSMNYNYQDIDGTCCTGFAGLVTGADGEQKCAWNSTWDIAEVDSTSNVPKGYSFVGLTQNLENTISDIASIPATYNWIRSNETAYKGNVCFDFMTSDTKGDSTSSSAQELMLWLRYEGGQLPIGWADGAGVNTDTGIIVSSLLVDQGDQYYGYFAGDIKDWLSAMVKQGLFTSSTYVNVGNAGMEPFYGTVSFKNELGFKINLA